MSGNKPISLMDPAEAAIGSMEVHVNNAGADEMVTLTQIQTFLSVDYSLTEQVWPFAKWIGGQTIYWRTWDLGDGDNAYHYLTGLLVAEVGSYAQGVHMYIDTSAGSAPASVGAALFGGEATYKVFLFNVHWSNYVIMWYTKV